MTLTATRRLVPLALALPLALSACGSDRTAQTYQPRTPQDSVNASVGDLQIRNARVLPPPDGEAWPLGSDALVSLAVANDGGAPDRLTGGTSDVAAAVVLRQAGQVATAVSFPPRALAGLDVVLVLKGITRELRAGDYVGVSLSFAQSGTSDLRLPVAVGDLPAARSTTRPERPFEEKEEGSEEAGEPTGAVVEGGGGATAEASPEG